MNSTGVGIILRDHMSKRRELILALGFNLLVAPLLALAQPEPKAKRIGVLSGGVRPVSLESSTHGSFLKGMRDLGYVEGKDLSLNGVSPRDSTTVWEATRRNSCE